MIELFVMLYEGPEPPKNQYVNHKNCVEQALPCREIYPTQFNNWEDCGIALAKITRILIREKPDNIEVVVKCYRKGPKGDRI